MPSCAQQHETVYERYTYVDDILSIKPYLARIKVHPQGSAGTALICSEGSLQETVAETQPLFRGVGVRVHCLTMLHTAVPSSTPMCSCLRQDNSRYTTRLVKALPMHFFLASGEAILDTQRYFLYCAVVLSLFLRLRRGAPLFRGV